MARHSISHRGLVEEVESEEKEKTRKSRGLRISGGRKILTQTTPRQVTTTKGKTNLRKEYHHNVVEEVHQDKTIAQESSSKNVKRNLYIQRTRNKENNRFDHNIVENNIGNNRKRNNSSNKAKDKDRTQGIVKRSALVLMQGKKSNREK